MVNNVPLYEHVCNVKMHHRHIVAVFGSQVAIVVVVIPYTNERGGQESAHGFPESKEHPCTVTQTC